jgi:hypothetical protein
MVPRLISLASTKTSPKNMGHGQRVADWGDPPLAGTIVPTCDRPIGDGPGREANVNGAGKEDAVNYKNNPLRQASKCAGDTGLCPECVGPEQVERLMFVTSVDPTVDPTEAG